MSENDMGWTPVAPDTPADESTAVTDCWPDNASDYPTDVQPVPVEDPTQTHDNGGIPADVVPSEMPADVAAPVVEATGWEMRPEQAELREDAALWFQQGTNFTCGPAAVTQILEDFTGTDYQDEFAVANDAAAMGWLGDKGMPLEAVDDLLTRWGVPSHVESAGPDPTAAFQTVDQYIAEGRSVVMFVDASEYWEGADRDAYHFVRVLDVDWDRGVAVLSDSGTPNGQGLEVPLATLNEAWAEGLEGQNAPTYGMVVSDVTDPDGVGVYTAATSAGTSAADQVAIEPSQPFCLLPVTMTPSGYEEVLTCCGTPPPPETAPVSGPGMVITSENPLAPTDPSVPGTTITPDNPMATADPSAPGFVIEHENPLAPLPTVAVPPVATGQPGAPAVDVDTSTGPFLDDIETILADRRALIESGQWQQGTEPPLDPSLSPIEGERALDNAAMTQSGLTPEYTTRITDPMTGDTGYVPDGNTTPSLPYTQNADRPPDAAPPLSPST
jgi:hypothetical protein